MTLALFVSRQMVYSRLTKRTKYHMTSPLKEVSMRSLSQCQVSSVSNERRSLNEVRDIASAAVRSIALTSLTRCFYFIL